MRRLSLTFVAIALFIVCVAPPAGAQEDTPTTFVYATYFECDTSRQWRVDEIVESVYVPIYDAAVEDGTIKSWGWLAHHTGGKWRRVLYYSAEGMDALLDSAGAVRSAVAEENPNAGREFGEICGPHDDYIWQVGPTSRGAGLIAQERGEAALSVYMHCKMSEEDRADEIVEEIMAPIYNSFVKDGSLSSWGWLKHNVGGKWRRVATMTAPDMKQLMAARAAIFEEFGKKHEAVGKEFNEICGSHQDYLWDVVHETP